MDTLESAACDLSEVRYRLDAAREALEGVGDVEAIRVLVARLERIAAEVARIELVCESELTTVAGK
ncbi:MAG: hypothetical protein JWN86_2231 [Planctomycetota bacterium]|nr:hypothetical protein [Planctomycetota bacterium]